MVTKSHVNTIHVTASGASSSRPVKKALRREAKRDSDIRREPRQIRRSCNTSIATETRSASVGPAARPAPGARSAHRPLLDRHQIVVTGEVQPAVHDVERELFRERAAVFPGVRGGGVGRHANLARETSAGWLAKVMTSVVFRISEKIGVEPGEVRIGEQGTESSPGGQPPRKRAACASRMSMTCRSARRSTRRRGWRLAMARRRMGGRRAEGLKG